MRLDDLEEAKKEQPIKARDPNWRDMEALRKSGAAGSHGDKTKTIPRKEKYKKIPMEDQFAQYMAENNKEEQIKAWWDKWSKYEGGNGNTMPEGYLEYALDSGIGTDFFNADEYIALSKQHDPDGDAETEMDYDEMMSKMPLTKQCMDEINAITGTNNLEKNGEMINDVIGHFESYKPTLEADPDELGPMNDKMKALLSKVHDDEEAQKQIDKEKADAERQAKAKELGPKAMDEYIAKLKSHDWTYQYSDDHRYWKKGSEEASEIRRLQQVLDPNFEIYNKYAPEGFGVKMNKESMYEDQQENIVSMNVPLLIRVLEYAREDAESDVDLHNIIEKAITMSGEEPLTMKDYDSLVQKDLPAPQEPKEVKKEHSDIFKALEKVEETASPGATSAGNIATVNNPHIAIGDRKTRKKYGSLVGAMPNPPKAKMQKPSDNALDMKGTSIFGGTLKR